MRTRKQVIDELFTYNRPIAAHDKLRNVAAHLDCHVQPIPRLLRRVETYWRNAIDPPIKELLGEALHYLRMGK